MYKASNQTKDCGEKISTRLADRSSQSFAVPRHLNFSVMEVDLSANVASGSNSSCKSAEQLHDIYVHLCLQSDVMKGKRRHVMQHNVDYVCMYVCMYVCVWMDGWTDRWMDGSMHAWIMCACMHLCMYARMHVWMYVCVHSGKQT